MKLIKAVEILDDCTKGALLGISQDTKDAIELGIEALNRILKERKIEDDPGWGHLASETKDYTPEEKEQTGFAGRPCCACRETITGDDTKANTVMLRKKAPWDYPTWGNVPDGTGGMATAVLCGKCVEENRQPEYALKLNGDDWTNPKDIELVPLADLEDA